MKIAIMQPYLLLFIGYIQLINTIDEIVTYDKIIVMLNQNELI